MTGLRIEGLIFDNHDLMTNNKILAQTYYNHGEESHIDTGKWPTSKVQVSPRLGFSYDVFGDKSLKVRGGTGLFSGRLPLVFFTNMPTNSGSSASSPATWSRMCPRCSRPSTRPIRTASR